MTERFKAWNRATNTVHDVLVIDWVAEVADLSGGLVEKEFDEIEFMRPTGVSDKYGTPIYEGSFLKINDDEIGLIDFFEGAFYVDVEGVVLKLSEEYQHGEVVGNKYEDPEYLDQ